MGLGCVCRGGGGGERGWVVGGMWGGGSPGGSASGPCNTDVALVVPSTDSTRVK